MAPPPDPDLVRRLEERLKARSAAIRLRVVILGPGRTDPEFGKRQTVREHLEREFPTDEFIFPEDVIPASAIDTMGIVVPESELFPLVDLVLAIVPPLSFSSVHGELAKHGPDPMFQAKLHVFRPAGRGSPAMTYLEDFAYGPIDENRFFDYTLDAWRECNDIRAFATQKVRNERNRQLYVTGQ